MAFKRFPDIIIRNDNFDEDIKALIKEIRPDWVNNSLKTKRFHGGVSNLLYGVYVDETITNETDIVLVRIYGEILLNRNFEMENMTALSKCDLAAKVYGQFANGCAYQYIHGSTLDLDDVKKDFFVSLIINEFVRLHSVKIDVHRSKEPLLFIKMREMASRLPDFLEDPKKNEKYLSHFPRKLTIFKEIACLEKHLTKSIYPVTFCHNDLIVNNMILNLKRDRIHLIDFEYADYNYIGFEIGNHFNEFAGLENIDFSRYPDEAFQKSWIRKYLEALLAKSKVNGSVHNGEKYEIEENQINDWYRMVNKFSLASNLFWCIWSIWQEQNSSINFDYLNYAFMRWNQYIIKKADFLKL